MLHTAEEHTEASAVPGPPELEADPYPRLTKAEAKKLKAELDNVAVILNAKVMNADFSLTTSDRT